MPTKIIVTVLAVENLPKTDLMGKCDPFVRIRLDDVQRQTKTVRKVCCSVVLQCGAVCCSVL